MEYRSVYNASHLHTVFPCCRGSRVCECAASRGPRRDVVLEDVGHPETSSGPPRFPHESRRFSDPVRNAGHRRWLSSSLAGR